MKKVLAFCLAVLILIVPFTSAFAADEDLPRVWSISQEMTR